MSINQLLNQYEESSSQREQGINNYVDKNYGKDSALLNLPVESAQSRLQEIGSKFMDEMGIDFGAKGLYGLGLRGVKYVWGDNAFKDLGDAASRGLGKVSDAIGDRLPSFSTQDISDAFSSFRSGASGVTDRLTNGFNTMQEDLRRVPVRVSRELDTLTDQGRQAQAGAQELADIGGGGVEAADLQLQPITAGDFEDVRPTATMDIQSADMGGLDAPAFTPPTYSAMDIAEMERESVGLRAEAMASSRRLGLGTQEIGGTQTFQYQAPRDPAQIGTIEERYASDPVTARPLGVGAELQPEALEQRSALARVMTGETPDLPTTSIGLTAPLERGMERVPTIEPTITPPVSAVRQQEQVSEVQPTVEAPTGRIPQVDPIGTREYQPGRTQITIGQEEDVTPAVDQELGQTAEQTAITRAGETAVGGELGGEATAGMLGEVFSAIPVLGEIGFGIAAVVEGVKAASEEASATAKIRGAISDAEFESGYETLRPALGQMSASSFDTAELSQGLFQHF